MKLLIAIPALNEEEAIESIVERCLAAREEIIAGSDVTAVEITVVSDGSTDSTAERARAYKDEIHLIEFPQNRGYGAAILEAWSQSDAELMGFLDADGTCDPRFFTTLCNAVLEGGADVALGCRLHKKSQMPRVRRVGNTLFSTLLTLLSGRSVRDTASGMRVVRRDRLEHLMPLPTGLHFTPAMTARAVLRGDVSLSETDMPYHERTGRSKLSVIKDGFRFLGIILDAAFLYRPSRPLFVLAILSLLVAVGLMVSPILHYLRHQSLEEWMIYRFIVSQLLGTVGFLTLCTAYLSRRIVRLTVLSRRADALSRGPLGRFLTSPGFWLLPTLLLAFGGWLVWGSFRELLATGATAEHWSRFIAMAFFASLALILVVTRILDHSLSLIGGWLSYRGRLSGSLGDNSASSND